MKMIADSGLALSLYHENTMDPEIKCIYGILGPLLGLSIRPIKR